MVLRQSCHFSSTINTTRIIGLHDLFPLGRSKVVNGSIELSGSPSNGASVACLSITLGLSLCAVLFRILLHVSPHVCSMASFLCIGALAVDAVFLWVCSAFGTHNLATFFPLFVCSWMRRMIALVVGAPFFSAFVCRHRDAWRMYETLCCAPLTLVLSMICTDGVSVGCPASAFMRIPSLGVFIGHQVSLSS